MVFEVILVVQLLTSLLVGYNGTFKQIKLHKSTALVVFPLAMFLIPFTAFMGKMMKVMKKIDSVDQEHTSIGIIVTGLPTNWLEKIVILLVIQLLINWLLLPRLQEWKVK
jgi:hypothetical protein